MSVYGLDIQINHTSLSGPDIEYPVKSGINEIWIKKNIDFGCRLVLVSDGVPLKIPHLGGGVVLVGACFQKGNWEGFFARRIVDPRIVPMDRQLPDGD